MWVGSEVDPGGGDERWDGDKGAEPGFGVPRQSEKAFVPKVVVGKEADREDLPGVGAAPGRQRQNPGEVPRMEDRGEDERGAERPEHPAFPVPKEKE